MTILFLTRRFYPHIGGVEKHVMEISKQLIKKGHRVVVITEAPKRSEANYKSAPAEKFKKINGIEIYRIKAGKEDWFKKFRIWKELWNLRQIIKTADIIHCHDVFFWYLPFRFLYPRKPVYTTFHGYERFPITKKVILMHRISEKLSYGNICIGDFISKWYGTKADYVSYGGVDIETQFIAGASLQLAPKHSLKNADLQDRSEAGYKPAPAETAVFIGRLDDQTGILTYVKAFEILKKKYPNFELAVVGDGEYKPLIEKKVKVFGFQKNPEKYLRQYRFAFVSRYLSILEAMAHRRLVFAVFDNPVKEDYLKMALFSKYIIIEKDENSLAAKIDFYLKYPKKEKALIDNAYKWASLQTWEQMVDIYLKLWNNN